MLKAVKFSPFGYALHQTILDDSGTPIDYRFLEVNESFERITGLSAQQIVNKTVTEVMPGIQNSAFDWISYYGNLSITGVEQSIEQYSEILDKWFQVQVGVPQRGYFTTLFVDISEQKERTAELENFFHVNLDLLCIADTDGHFIRVNREWSNILGYTTEDLESRQFLDFVHPDDLDSTLKTLSLLDEQKDVINFVNRYRCKDGSYRFIEWRSHPQGKRIYAAARDITDRMKNDALLQSYLSMQEILIRMSSRFINIPLEHMDSAINDSLREIGTFIHSDRSYVFEYRWAEQYCINTHEWCNAGTSSQMAKLQHVDVTDVSEWTAAHRSGSAIVISDVQTLETDSRIRHILLEQEVKSLLTIPMMERDECIGFIGFDWVHTLHEYSEKEKLLLTMFSDMLINFFNRFKLERNLVEARDLANSANQAKSDFLANMSHEIRTPMNAIIGLTSLVMDSTLTEEQYGFLRKIDISSKLLMEIINNVLDFSKIEAGKMEIDEHPFSFETIIDQLQSLFSESAKEKNIELFLSLDSKIPRFLIGDSLRLYQVLANIVSNAIKFTENGSVTCSITLASAHGSETRVAFTISDTGIGMNRDELAGLFRAFSQADSSTSRKYGGTGLGLVISSRLVSAMGGSISATSQRGKGSTFSFELVFQIPVPSETDAVNREIFVPSFTTQETGRYTFSGQSWPKARVLLVEDNELNQEVAVRLLRKASIEADIAPNGFEAVRAVSRHPYDLILMDIQMPGMDGYEASKKIRKHCPTVPIIALSAAVLDEDRRRVFDSGMNGHIGKPIDSSELLRVLHRFLTSPTKGPVPDDSPITDWTHADLPGFSVSQGLHALAGDELFYRKILLMFRDQLDREYKDVESILSGDNPVEAKRCIHTLKGLAGTVAANDIHAIATEIDYALSQNMHVSETHIRALQQALDVARSSLAQLSNIVDDTSVSHKIGKEALDAMRQSLMGNHPVDDDLLSQVISYLERIFGPGSAKDLATMVDEFEYDKAMKELADLENRIKESDR